MRLILGLLAVGWSGATVAEKPNVLLIVADEQGYNDLGLLGNGIITPTLDRLAVEFVELRLVVEELQLAGAAGHEEVDDALGLGAVVRRLRRERVGGRRGLVRREQRRQGDRAEAHAAVAEEVAAGAAEEAEGVSHG